MSKKRKKGCVKSKNRRKSRKQKKSPFTISVPAIAYHIALHLAGSLIFYLVLLPAVFGTTTVA